VGETTGGASAPGLVVIGGSGVVAASAIASGGAGKPAKQSATMSAR
jgi:hypothetical protein